MGANGHINLVVLNCGKFNLLEKGISIVVLCDEGGCKELFEEKHGQVIKAIIEYLMDEVVIKTDSFKAIEMIKYL